MEPGSVNSNRKILLETYGGAVHFRRGSQKYHLKIKPIRYAYITGPYKVIYNLKDKTIEAYELKKDIFETSNIYIDGPQILKEIKKDLLDTAATVTKYIQLNKSHHLEGDGLSPDDLNRLKSLGYVYEKE